MATDTEILTAVGDILTASVPSGWRVVQNFQPTGQARHADTTIYFAKMGDRPVGFPERVEIWNPDTEAYDHRHSQVFVSTIRVQGFANRDSPDATLTPGDVTAWASLALQTDAMRAALARIDAQALRVVNLPALQIVDERDRWEEVASFDFLVTHSRVMLLATPAATLGPVSIYSV